MDLSKEVVLEIPFPIFSNVDIKFAWKKLTWKFCTTAKSLPTIKRVEIIDRKEFAKTALNKHVEAFMVYKTSLATMAIYLEKKT